MLKGVNSVSNYTTVREQTQKKRVLFSLSFLCSSESYYINLFKSAAAGIKCLVAPV